MGAGVGPSSPLVGGGGSCSPLVWGRGGPCSPLVGGHGGPCSSFVGGRWVLIVGRCRRSWALVRGVVLGRVRRWWGGAGTGPLSSLVGWCWYWAVVIVGGVVMGHCRHSWGGAGPGSSSLMLGVVMGHRLGGWWWALVAVMLCWVEIGRRTMIVRRPVATSLTWHLASGLANSKGEGGLTLSLSIVWRPRRRLRRGNSVPVIVASRRCGRLFDW